MNGKIYKLALVGKDVSQSDSERIHRFILSQMGVACEYENVSVSADGFDCAVRRLLGDFDGFNVTIPYKRDVLEYLDEFVGDALDYGAVNTVLSATRQGFNTDGVGFMQMLSFEKVTVQGKKALVLGGGGAGRSTAVSLKKAGAEVFMYQRNREKLQETCKELQISAAESVTAENFAVIVNATGVGMHDTVGVSPVGADVFDGVELAVDLIYKPRETEFLRLAKTRGCRTVSGGAMLFFQAYYSDCYYLGRTADRAEADKLYEKYLSEDNV